MKKLTRILTMGGFGLLTALATGAGPANAASAHNVPEGKSSSAHQAIWRSGDQVVGYYRTLRGCELSGRYGERTGEWDDHYCSIVRIGPRHGAWALQVASDTNWHRFGFGRPFGNIHRFPGQFRPVWPGVFRPGPFGGPRGPVFGGPRGPFGGPRGPIVVIPRGPFGGGQQGGGQQGGQQGPVNGQGNPRPGGAGGNPLPPMPNVK